MCTKITLNLRAENTQSVSSDIDDELYDGCEYEELKTKWTNNIKDEYTNAFSDEDIRQLNLRLDNLRIADVTQELVDNIADDLCKLCIDPAKHIGICKSSQTAANCKTTNSKKRQYFGITTLPGLTKVVLIKEKNT